MKVEYIAELCGREVICVAQFFGKDERDSTLNEIEVTWADTGAVVDSEWHSTCGWDVLEKEAWRLFYSKQE